MSCVAALLTTSNGFAQTKDGWEVIGINAEKKLIAYRNVYTKTTAEEGEPVSCGYQGVEKGYGVQLGVWSVEQNESIQTWDIYQSVMDPNNCTPKATAKNNLATAKDYYASKNIDISSPPAPIKKTQKNTYSLLGTDGKTHDFFPP